MKKKSFFPILIVIFSLIMSTFHVSAETTTVTMNNYQNAYSDNAMQVKQTFINSKNSRTVKPAKLSRKNKQARKAYKKLLEKQIYKRTKDQKFRYTLIDLDNNGIDELLLDSNSSTSAGQYNRLYTYKNGKVKKLLQIPFVTFIVYTDGTLESFWGHTGYIENKFYKLKNGTVKKQLVMEGGISSPGAGKKPKKNIEYRDGYYWSLKKIGNKNASYAACQNWIKKFTSTHKKLNLKYKNNTNKNRVSMLKRR